MTIPAGYTKEEWSGLLQAPMMAGLVVMLAGRSGPIQAIKEIFAIGKALHDTRQQGSSNALISAVVDALKSGSREDVGPQPQLKSVEEARARALTHLGDVSGTLARRASPAQAEEFKRWLVSISQNVAEAAKEGGVLGFGGTQVSAEETTALKELRSALGVSG